MLETAATTEGKMRTRRRQPLRAGLQHPLDPRLDQFAARPQHPGVNLLARQAAFGEDGTPLPAADATAIVGQTFQREFDALPDGGRRIGRPPWFAAESVHGRLSKTPVDR